MAKITVEAVRKAVELVVSGKAKQTTVGRIYIHELKNTSGPLGQLQAKILRLARIRGDDFVMIGFVAVTKTKRHLYLNSYGYKYWFDTDTIPEPKRTGTRLGAKTLQVGNGVFFLAASW